jgi:serine/threonine-protein kinase
MHRKRRLELVEALRVSAEIARGLAAAHSVGVVHRDLKPDNVMLAGQRVVITDFGIARLTGVVGDANQSLGLILGTPAYMAPEQVEGRELDGRADIYALGIVLYQLLTGELPFVGDTPFAIAAARLHGDPPDPSTKDPTLPPAIVALVRDAMARRRDARPDAQALLARLDELRAGRFEEQRVAAVPTPVSRATPNTTTTVAVVPFTGDPTIAVPLTDALGDALCALRGIRVTAPGAVGSATSAHLRDGVLDPSSLARALGASLVISGTARASGSLARVAVRLFDATKNSQEWAERFDMDNDAFAIEDRVVTRVVETLRGRVEERPGPRDPVAADLYRRAREKYATFFPTAVGEAIAILEDAHQRFPRDTWITGALAAALVRSWMFQTQTDSAIVKRAEEMALRALAADPGRGEALLTIGIIRWQFGELPAAARAFEDAIVRTPTLGEAHEYLGQMLSESGHAREALRHLELAIQFDPLHRTATLERLRIYDLTGETELAARELRALQTEARSGIGRAFAPFRSVIWRRDLEGVRSVREAIAAAPEAERDYYLPMIDETYKALIGEPFVDRFRAMADAPHASLRRRSYFYQLSAEMNAYAGRVDDALDALERAADVLLFDVLWLDRCPILDSLRDHPRFARVRAVAGARAAAIWNRS